MCIASGLAKASCNEPTYAFPNGDIPFCPPCDGRQNGTAHIVGTCPSKEKRRFAAGCRTALRRQP